MTRDPSRSRRARFNPAAFGERLAGFVYGTILVLSVIVAGAKAFPHGAGQIAALVVVTSGVFWLAHLYAHGLAFSVGQKRHLSLQELREIAQREASIVEACVPSVAVLLMGALGVISTKAAVWAALGLGLVVLAVEGVLFARVERLSRLGTAAVVAANLGLGLVLIGLKLLVIH